MRMLTRFLLPLFLFIISPLHGWSQSGGLFESNELLTITLSGSITEVLKDRTGDPQYFNITLSYKAADSTTVTIPLKVRTRGNFRRLKSNCALPPLMLSFAKEGTKGTMFNHQDKLKLVTPCRGDDYVVREYLVYKLYNLITPKSFRARLVKVIFDDPDLKTKEKQPFYGIILEDEDQVAERNNMITIERKLVRPEHTQVEDFLTMAVFEYLIGNTDWSVQFRQNVKLMGTDTVGRPYTVPYDFDHAGIVGAPYAQPAPQLLLSSTKERRYRGFCISEMQHFDKVIEHYNSKKEAIYANYTTSKLIDERYLKSTVKYLDEFYKTINDPKKVREEFQYPCRADGTGNVVIKGLNKN